MSNFAAGRESWRICDRCGWRAKYHAMRQEPNRSWVCVTCYDVPFDIIKHPQNLPPPVSPDPQALEHPRKDEGMGIVMAWTVTMTTGG